MQQNDLLALLLAQPQQAQGVQTRGGPLTRADASRGNLYEGKPMGVSQDVLDTIASLLSGKGQVKQNHADFLDKVYQRG